MSFFDRIIGNVKLSPFSSVKVPSKEWFQSAADSCAYTPDMWRLERYKSVLLFVPDEMMKGHVLHPLIEPVGEFRGKCFTEDTDFILWKKDSGIDSMAIPMQGAWQNTWMKGMTLNGEPMYPLSRICGELYKINVPSYLKKLDEYHQNTISSLRQRVKLLLPYRIVDRTIGTAMIYSPDQFLQPINAWMYIGARDFWEDHIQSPNFRPLNYIKPNTPKLGKMRMDNYYFFAKTMCLEDENVTAPYISKNVQDSSITPAVSEVPVK